MTLTASARAPRAVEAELREALSGNLPCTRL